MTDQVPFDSWSGDFAPGVYRVDVDMDSFDALVEMHGVDSFEARCPAAPRLAIRAISFHAATVEAALEGLRGLIEKSYAAREAIKAIQPGETP